MVIVLIPAYNEENTIVEVLSGLPMRIEGRTVRPIVVNDGSTDSTAELVRRLGIELLDFPVNRGKGAVLKDGLQLIADEDFEALALMDADGQHDPGSLISIVSPVLNGSVDVVVGSRYTGTPGRGATPWNRYLVRSFVRAALRLLLGADVSDPFSGYRALSPGAVVCLELSGDRYESELEMLFCVERSSLTMCEVPISKIYGEGTSKMGARFGSLLGRVDVVARYALTILREAKRHRSTPGHEADRVKAA